MKYYIEKLNIPLTICNKNKKIITLTGYAFHNSSGGCMFIVWGESRKNLIIKTLFEKSDIKDES